MEPGPFGNLFLILALVLAIGVGAAPKGLPVDIAIKKDDCGDGPPMIIVSVVGGDRVQLNSKTFETWELGGYLKEIFRDRDERLLFVRAEPDAAFREVAEIIDVSRKYADHVAVLTRSVETKPGGCLMINTKSFADYNRVKPLIEMKELPLWRLFWPW